MKKEERNYETLNKVLLSIIFIIWVAIAIIYIKDNKTSGSSTQENVIDNEEKQLKLEAKNRTIAIQIAQKAGREVEINTKTIVVVSKATTNIFQKQLEFRNRLLLEIENKKRQFKKAQYYKNIKTIGNVNPKYIDGVAEQLLLIPDNIVNSFFENSWNMYITTENIAQVYFNGQYNSVQAVTTRSKKQIVIENRIEAITGSVIHEVGHYVDYINGEICLSQEFMEIYYEEVNVFKSKIPNSSCVSNQCEFFAETFYYAIKDPSKCTPRALEYVRRYL